MVVLLKAGGILAITCGFVLLVLASATSAISAADTPPPGDGRPKPGVILPPRGFTITVSKRCYEPFERVAIRVTRLAPATRVSVDGAGSASVSTVADTRGRAVLRILTPSAPPGGALVTAQLVAVSGSGASGGFAVLHTAYVFGTHRACAALARLAASR